MSKKPKPPKDAPHPQFELPIIEAADFYSLTNFRAIKDGRIRPETTEYKTLQEVYDAFKATPDSLMYACIRGKDGSSGRFVHFPEYLVKEYLAKGRK